MSQFARTVADFQRKAEIAILATAREASKSLMEEALNPRAKGGRLGVDTGALRNSFVAAVNSIPSGQSTPEGLQSVAFDMQPLVLAINRVRLGDRLVIGTAMNYAKYHEAQTGFIRLAAQNWPQHVAKAAVKVRSAIR